MKLKLFIISILALISLIAYQKYSEYSSLKSINSYESCVAAKGSMIQTSYPAKCVTRLGTRFTQSIQISRGSNTFSGNLKIYSNDKYHYSVKYPSEYKYEISPSEWGNIFSTSETATNIATESQSVPLATLLSMYQNDTWITMYVFPSYGLKNIDEYYQSERYSYYSVSKKSDFLLNDNKGLKIVYSASHNGLSIYSYEGILLKDDSVYSVSLNSVNEKTLQSRMNELDQILNSFKFTN